MCGDNDMAAQSTIWAENLHIRAQPVFVNFGVHISGLICKFLLMLTDLMEVNLI